MTRRCETSSRALDWRILTWLRCAAVAHSVQVRGTRLPRRAPPGRSSSTSGSECDILDSASTLTTRSFAVLGLLAVRPTGRDLRLVEEELAQFRASPEAAVVTGESQDRLTAQTPTDRSDLLAELILVADHPPTRRSTRAVASSGIGLRNRLLFQVIRPCASPVSFCMPRHRDPQRLGTRESLRWHLKASFSASAGSDAGRLTHEVAAHESSGRTAARCKRIATSRRTVFPPSSIRASAPRAASTPPKRGLSLRRAARLLTAAARNPPRRLVELSERRLARTTREDFEGANRSRPPRRGWRRANSCRLRPCLSPTCNGSHPLPLARGDQPRRGRADGRWFATGPTSSRILGLRSWGFRSLAAGNPVGRWSRPVRDPR